MTLDRRCKRSAISKAKREDIHKHGIEEPDTCDQHHVQRMLNSNNQVDIFKVHRMVEEVSSVKALKQDASNEERSLLAQSLVARASRRKISDKTQELGKLIPGRQKMNTTETFQAVFKYVRVLHSSNQIYSYKHKRIKKRRGNLLRPSPIGIALSCTFTFISCDTRNEEVELNPKGFNVNNLGDDFHPQLREIHKELDQLVTNIKKLRYVPDIDFVLHELDEKGKEQCLDRHSEKIVIMYW
nr:Myc-type, basic helix-loop-helix (bHLH) domain-containing protein [Tanacetum cinerariifolium]